MAVVMLCAAAAAETPQKYAPAEHYRIKSIGGFTVRVNNDLLEQRDLADKTLKILEYQLFEMTRRLPSHAADKLRDIEIWVELADENFFAMCYHVSRHWLENNGYNPEKERSVEISNAANFINATKEQPFMVLHEFAHAWHHNFVSDGYENSLIKDTYQLARDSGKYEQVLHINGTTVRHYAMTNHIEYFAELSESYFGTNDFYPFVRPQLYNFDRNGYQMVEKIWQTP